MELKLIKLDIPKDCQIILGQSHFIKTVEDLHEAMVNSVPGIKFGLAFCESSGPCLVRHSGTDEELEKIAAEQALKLGAGHCFLIIMRGAYPINVLNRIKEVPEVCAIYCATGNPIKVLIIEDEEKNRGIAGVIDGSRSKGIENEENIKERKEFLRKIGYKL
ncbi:MAG: adenosine-specific kinase [Nitrososphaerota archaeon]